MNITIKDIPEELHAILRHQAEVNGRSLNKQILFSLDRICRPKKSNRELLLKRIRERRETWA